MMIDVTTSRCHGEDMIEEAMLHRPSGLTLRHVMEAKYGAPVYSLHPPMVATFPDMPLDNSPEYHDINVTDLEQNTCLNLALADCGKGR